MYDILVVGCGLCGAVFAREAAEKGYKVLIIEKNPYVAGMAYTESIHGIEVHMCGPHYFHTNDKSVWDYVNRFAEFNDYRAKVNAFYKGGVLSLPFNMWTFNQLWGCRTPEEAKNKIGEQIIPCEKPINLEELSLSTVGREIYEKLIYGYTVKFWGKLPKELPASIIKRIPLRFAFDNNYHTARYAGVPVDGYTNLVENMIDGIEIKLNEDFFDLRDWKKLAIKLVYTGPIDRFFNYKYGRLEYRGIKFEHRTVCGDYQGIGQVNYTDIEVPYTRIAEHKHFYGQQCKKSVISYEYPDDGVVYPLNDKINNNLHKRYLIQWNKLENVIGGGRLFDYKYYDMDQVILQALKNLWKK